MTIMMGTSPSSRTDLHRALTGGIHNDVPLFVVPPTLLCPFCRVLHYCKLHTVSAVLQAASSSTASCVLSTNHSMADAFALQLLGRFEGHQRIIQAAS
jgi:hypothetical protein